MFHYSPAEMSILRSKWSTQVKAHQRNNVKLSFPPQVPCLIKELLQKHLNPSGAKQKTVTSPVPAGRSAATPAGSLSQALKAEDPAQKWLMGPEAGPPRVTAFTPVKQGVPQSRNDHIQRESDRSPPFTLEDLSADIYRKISARYAARPQPLYAQSLSSNASDTPPNLQQTHAGVDSWAGKGGMQVTFLEEDVADVTSTSAQKILEEFLRQLQPPQEVPEGEEERSRREKMAAEKHTEQGAGWECGSRKANVGCNRQRWGWKCATSSPESKIAICA